MNASATEKKRVLVVDDDPDIVDLLTMVLQDTGYEVASASDGNEALHQVVATHPDVIILDIIMPGLDGWEVADHLLSHDETAGIPIIFLTARARAEDQLRGWYAGCFDYLTKPFEVDQLLDRIRAATTGTTEAVRQLAADLRRQRVAELQGEETEDSRGEGGRPTA